MTDFNQDLAMALLKDDNDYPVSLDDAWQWLGYSRKDKAKDKLVNNFEQGVDYIFLLPQMGESDNRAGSSVQEVATQYKREQIYLSVDCFKQLGMMAGTAKGKEVRLYFLDCEKVLKQQLQRINQLSISEQVVTQLTSFIEEQRVLNASLMERTKKLDQIEQASTEHKGARAVIDAEINDETSEDDTYLSVDQYLLSIGLLEVESSAKNAIKRRAAGFYRADKHREPKKIKNRCVYAGSDIEYIRQAVKSVLGL